jgi:MinD-like ATPase involved in chromosome partitioning or flagellar assembly
MNQDTIGTIIIAPAEEARQIRNLLTEVQPGKYQILSVLTDLGSEETLAFVLDSEATLVLVHQNVERFSTQALSDLAHTPGKVARVVAAFVEETGDVFDAALKTGAIVYFLPIREAVIKQLDAVYRQKHAEATQASAAGNHTRPQIPQHKVERVITPGIRRQRTQVITVWSSKGGDGKSSIAAELGYMLANVAGRTVLLVDADMNRGYLAPALGEEAMQYARVRNIATMATVFQNKQKLPRFAEYVYNYAPAFGKGVESNLDILFGIASMDQANLSAFTDRGGGAGEEFIDALIDAAENRYEFVIFDIGTLVPVHVHQAALKAASQLIVVSSPIIPAIQPTKAGIDQMKTYGIIDENADKAILVLNKYTENNGLARDEFPRFIQLPLMATIPLVSEGLLHSIINQGSFFMEHFFHSKNTQELGVMSQQLLALCEFFSPGALAFAQEIPKLNAVISESSRGLFRRRKR